MSVQTIYVVTVNGKPVYSHTQRSEADIEADLQGGIVTQCAIQLHLFLRSHQRALPIPALRAQLGMLQLCAKVERALQLPVMQCAIG